jgi:hypothetical protein
MDLPTRAPAALLALNLLSACAVCERATAADGVYPVTSDCAGRLVTGSLTIGGPSPGGCNAGDAGTHHGVASPDGGRGEADAGQPACAVQTAPMEDSCPETAASGTQALGLPAHVRVRGPGDFELWGEVDGRTLSCTPASFGDEQILFCRQGGQVVCAAAIGVH